MRRQDIPKLEARVSEIFNELDNLYPATPIVVYSPLAEGADQLVARVALAQNRTLIAPLPLPQTDYEKDFSSPDSRAEFQKLISLAQVTYFVGYAEGSNADAVRSYGPDRDRQYERVGAHVVEQSHILIALWDGRVNGLVGGTAEIVRFALQGLPGHYAGCGNLLDPIDRGPVYQIPAPRNSTLSGDDAFQPQILYPGSKEAIELFPSSEGAWHQLATYEDSVQQARAWNSVLQRIDRANREIRNVFYSSKKSVERNRAHFIPDERFSLLTEGECRTLNIYAALDTIAIKAQQHRRDFLRQILVSVFFGFVVFECYDNVLQPTATLASLFVAFVYPIVLLGCYVAYRRYESELREEAYIDYRAIAEGLRVQLAWRLLGVDESVRDRYLRHQTGALRWIREAIRSAAPTSRPDEFENTSQPCAVELRSARSSLALACWVGSEAEYYLKSSIRDGEELNRRHTQVEFAYKAGLIGVVVILLIDTLRLAVGNSVTAASLFSDIRGYAFVIFALFMVISVGIGAWIEKMALAEQVQQYSRMASLFERGQRLAEAAMAAGKTSELTEIARVLGDESLRENGDWLTLRRSRPVEIPRA